MSLPTTQKAWVTGYPTLDAALTLKTDFPVPEAAANQVIVKVHAVGINPVDWKLNANNWFGVKSPVPLGYDVSGVIAAVGAGVVGWKVGDEVVTGVSLLGGGGLAEYIVSDAWRLTYKPTLVSHVQAASLPVAGLSVYDGLAHHDLKGKTIYIAGGAGGVGHFAVQYALIKGATVITSASKPDALKYLRETLKLQHVIDYSKTNVVDEIKKITNGAGTDFAYDSTYVDSSFVQSIAGVRTGGTFIYLGQDPAATTAEGATARSITIAKADLVRYQFPPLAAEAPKIYAAGLTHFSGLVADSLITPLITTYPFDQSQAAIDIVRASKAVGKVVITVV